MRGAPQVGFSATIRKIKARTSLLTRFRPPTWLILETHVQYKRNPARCQFTTVLGVTKMRGLVHPDQNVLNATQNSLCRAVNRRRGLRMAGPTHPRLVYLFPGKIVQSITTTLGRGLDSKRSISSTPKPTWHLSC